MLKKLFTIGMLACAMFVFSANSAMAQNDKNYAPEYPRYGFKSNWSLGGELLFDMQYGNGNFWRRTANAGVGIVFEKEWSNIFASRLHLAIPGLWKPIENYDRLGKIGIDFKVSINNAIKGYDPDRTFSVYALYGAGWTSMYDGYVGMYQQAGLGMSWKCCKNSTMFLEYTHAALGDFHNFILGNWEDWEGTVALGWMYNWGPSAADQEMLAQASALSQEKFDAQNSELEGLRKDLNEAKRKEQRLINRINELEANQGGSTVVRKAEDGVADSLRKVIEGYETNKHNFYAMPFSILYDVDQYTVSEDQMNKIKAIAQIMKDNEDCNFEIIGYCDYSGSDAYNQKLSEKRAENVKKLLVKKYGIAEDRLTTSGKGKSMSFGDIKNAINRRVSFYRVNK